MFVSFVRCLCKWCSSKLLLFELASYFITSSFSNSFLAVIDNAEVMCVVVVRCRWFVVLHCAVLSICPLCSWVHCHNRQQTVKLVWIYIYTLRQKKGDTILCLYVHQKLTYFKNSFTGTLSSKFAIQRSHHISSMLLHYLVKYEYSKFMMLQSCNSIMILFTHTEENNRYACIEQEDQLQICLSFSMSNTAACFHVDHYSFQSCFEEENPAEDQTEVICCATLWCWT